VYSAKSNRLRKLRGSVSCDAEDSDRERLFITHWCDFWGDNFVHATENG
jgi:hypothetical protein